MSVICTGACLKAVIRYCLCLIRANLVGITSTLSVAIFLVCAGCRKPPDLSACTRIEVRYVDGALKYFLPDASIRRAILDEEEKERVRSYDTWTVTDQDRIREFASHISQGAYRGKQSGVTETQAEIICYEGSNRRASFAVHHMSITTGDRCTFGYPPNFLTLRSLDPSGITPLKMRWECAMNLRKLFVHGLYPGRVRLPCPDPDHWCDEIAANVRKLRIIRGEESGKAEPLVPERILARRFICPAVHETADVKDAHAQFNEGNLSRQDQGSWKADYAMNSNCREGSPDDMVFLFESKPGWNQHGGPELFTFDNHDPKGGCVLLNDGTVKFIRTEEELHALRWK